MTQILMWASCDDSHTRDRLLPGAAGRSAGVSVAAILVVCLACASGAALQAAAGFGFALMAAPFLVRLLGPGDAVALVAALAIVVNALTLGLSRASGATVLTVELLRLAPGAAAGVVAGALLLGVVPAAALQATLAAAVLAALVIGGRSGGVPVGAPRPGHRQLVAVAAGAMTTTIGVNGPPLVLWLRGRGATPEQLRATLAVAFLVAGAATLAVLAALGELGLGSGPILAGGAGVVAGHALGRRGAAAMAVARHERLVTATLALSAVAAALSAVVG